MSESQSWVQELQLPWTWLQVPEARPLNSFAAVAAMALAYLVLTALGTALMRGRKPFDTLALTVPWNLMMAVYSLYAFVGSFGTFWYNWAGVGFEPLTLLCDPTHSLMRDFDYWAYTFYLSKVRLSLPSPLCGVVPTRFSRRQRSSSSSLPPILCQRVSALIWPSDPPRSTPSSLTRYSCC